MIIDRDEELRLTNLIIPSDDAFIRQCDGCTQVAITDKLLRKLQAVKGIWGYSETYNPLEET